MPGKGRNAVPERRDGSSGLDSRRLRTVGGWLLKLAFAGILIKFAIDVILVQHEFFS